MSQSMLHRTCMLLLCSSKSRPVAATRHMLNILRHAVIRNKTRNV